MAQASNSNGMRRAASVQAALFRARDKNHNFTTTVSDPTSLAQGQIIFPANPLSNATITIGGTVVTFGTNVTIGASLTVTLASLLTYLNASADVNLVKCTYSVVGSTLNVKSKTPNNTTFSLAASAATVPHATLQLSQIRRRKSL